MISFHKRNILGMQVRTLAFIGDASSGISDEKIKIFFVPYLTLAEAHVFKNLAIFSKMNVAGITGSGSQRAMDMYLKCQYINELNAGRGIVFATGTPISNTMCEMYVMQLFLQKDTLEQLGIYHFAAQLSK